MTLRLLLLSSLLAPMLAIHVAFVIAGSPRSFIYPAVHESIRLNLISAFCPIDTCSADLFMRISASDNTHMLNGHAVVDGKGIRIAADVKELPLIQHALHRLHMAVRGVMKVNWVDVGSSAELEEMKAHFNSTRHRVFRELDPRRYSMYFGRWAAFQQAKLYEREQGLHYSWFVHTRFDMAFGEPIQPYYQWSSKKMWVHDMWAWDVPDIFALLPAEFADTYYSLDLLVQDNAMCLGGPNFSNATVEYSQLMKRGFDEEDLKTTKLVMCKDQTDGWSERILKRKLKLASVSLASKNIGFASIFSFVLRKSYEDLCQYLHPKVFFGWLWKIQHTNGAMYAGCINFVQDIRKEAAAQVCPTLPVMSDQEYEGDGCVFGKNISGWNYMPYRIRLPKRYGGHCLTATKDNASQNYSLSFQPCISLESFAKNPLITYTYSVSQLYRFHLGNTRPQYLRHLDYRMDKIVNWLCLTSTMLGNHTVKEWSSMLNKCDDSANQQLVSITIKRLRRHSKRKKRHAKHLQSAEFISIESNGLCLSFKYPSGLDSYATPSWSSCRREIRSKDGSQLRRVFIAERTSTAHSRLDGDESS